MVWAQAVDAVEVLALQWESIRKRVWASAETTQILPVRGAAVQLSQAIEVLYIIRTKYPTKLA